MSDPKLMQTDEEKQPDERPPETAGGGDEIGESPPPPPPTTGGQEEDPFDLNKLRVSQDFASQAGVKKVVTTVPCRKPNRHEFVRVRGGEDYRLETAVFEDKVTNEKYLVDRSLYAELASEIFAVCLCVAITRQGDLFLWPVKMPSDSGSGITWHESGVEAARLAESSWIRVAANMNAGHYDCFQAAGTLDEPDWPDISLQDLLRLCFRDRFIRDRDHPVLRSLRGEV